MTSLGIPPKAAAARLHVCLKTVYAWLLSGKLGGRAQGHPQGQAGALEGLPGVKSRKIISQPDIDRSVIPM